MPATDDAPLMLHAWQLLQVLLLAAGAGWIADRALHPGIHARGLPFLVGLAGMQLGRWVDATTAWWSGPSIAGYPLLPAFAGALALCGFLKMVSLGVQGSR